ncbi:hypothetical protein [Thalassoroseus pseudoceratinae]|uniref:hypothetical protein n=1 Tax=Thalassoroseus pseudoceratinae TaxID=2713176 RepID=UPI001423BD3A|nr:hypothetical protein [Thalassoroseus pseudoceratinae]
MTRDQVIEALGEPDAMGNTSRKYKTPSIFKYGDTELWFEPWKTGTLHGIWDEKNEKLLLGGPR